MPTLHVSLEKQTTGVLTAPLRELAGVLPLALTLAVDTAGICGQVSCYTQFISCLGDMINI